MTDLRPYHIEQLKSLAENLRGNTQRIKVRKNTVSNLFRYDHHQQTNVKLVDLSAFTKPLFIDTEVATLEVQGSATYETIVDFTLTYGFVPTIVPGLKHITVGGAIAGVAIESNCAKYGFAHDGLIEADVLLPSGKVVTCNASNEYADLFYALPNSYGTLGYILRAKIQLRPVKPYVVLETTKQSDVRALLANMRAATEDKHVDHIESLAYSKDNLLLTIGRQIEVPTQKPLSIYGKTIFYKEISKPGTLLLTTKDYIFRYDPEWFWAVPESKWLSVFRYLAPKKLRNSGFYTHLMFAKPAKILGIKPKPDFELLIQDWEVPWNQAEILFSYALETVDLNGRPWLSGPIRSPGTATLYPVTKGKLYLNLGCYASARKKPGSEAYLNTKLMDMFCIRCKGIKMLYSSSFMSKHTFDALYNGVVYRELKQKYDPNHLAPELYEKAVS